MTLRITHSISRDSLGSNSTEEFELLVIKCVTEELEALFGDHSKVIVEVNVENWYGLEVEQDGKADFNLTEVRVFAKLASEQGWHRACKGG